MKLSGWGRYPVIEAKVHAPRSVEALRQLVLSEPSVIARGNGRAYGDSAINPAATIVMRHLNRMIAFDTQTGQLVAEAGVLLKDVIGAFLPRGWFPLVTPGTKFVSLGGALAADVHGKNHHRDGSFRECVDWLDVMGADGNLVRCSNNENVEMFENTLGGMGLTGIILRAAIRLKAVDSGWIRQKTIAAPNLPAAMAAFEQAKDTTYSVAWLDCLASGDSLGRSVVMVGEHASRAELASEQAQVPFPRGKRRKLGVPFDFPSFTLNRFTIRAFNALYYRIGARKSGSEIVDWDSYFYPLDAIRGWNRIYGRKGFVQFQCVLPLERSEKGLTALLKASSDAGAGSFLTVLKRFGPQQSPFSFPMEGYTLAIDYPVTARTLDLLPRLDRITLDHGGRFYLAKDSRMSAETLQASDHRIESFLRMRRESSAGGKFRSAQSERLSL
ncbi:FAD-binding oxidoreductase [Roseovarius sp. S4756]|uniref:FAD-binding oxidoreductase n=1 Tax=Roseovarius maritimus TaxID=3342637 RepID=UPI00372CD154